MLGHGGFALAYLAEHTKLQTKVAIKEFFPKIFCNRDANSTTITLGTSANRELVERFKSKFVKEAQKIATLSHQGIVRILDIFEENNTAYYVMDYIEGK
ncbi:MAG: serine/threonine protein kinase, partial [Muribaculaceae bacterium]|nr:serine/threonine protein kinase [Muribaculaceae bacterium]